MATACVVTKSAPGLESWASAEMCTARPESRPRAPAALSLHGPACAGLSPVAPQSNLHKMTRQPCCPGPGPRRRRSDQGLPGPGASTMHSGQRWPTVGTRASDCQGSGRRLSDPHKRPVTVPKHSGALNAGIWPHAVLLTPGHSTFLKEPRATRLPPGHSDGRRTDMGTGGCTPGCSLLPVVASRAPMSP